MKFHEFKDKMWWCIEALRENDQTEYAIDDFLTDFYDWGAFKNKPHQDAEDSPSANILRLFAKLEILEAKAEEAMHTGLLCLINNIRICVRWWQQQEQP